MTESSVKDEIRQAIERLPDDATWADVAQLVAMHERLARARQDSAAGLGITSGDLRRRLGITR
jgi:hypothetical protein